MAKGPFKMKANPEGPMRKNFPSVFKKTTEPTEGVKEHLKNKTKEQAICNRQPGEYCSDDQLSILPGLGKKTETKLSKFGINNLGDLVEMTVNGIPEDLMKYCRENRILSKNIHEFVNHAKNAYVGSVPEDKDIDHQKACNPYESKYGSSWRDEVEKVISKKVICIKK